MTLELHVRLQLALVIDDPDPLYEGLAGGFGLTPDQARPTPYALAGPPESMIDALIERRERWGFSYIGVPGRGSGGDGAGGGEARRFLIGVEPGLEHVATGSHRSPSGQIRPKDTEPA